MCTNNEEVPPNKKLRVIEFVSKNDGSKRKLASTIARAFQKSSKLELVGRQAQFRRSSSSSFEQALVAICCDNLLLARHSEERQSFVLSSAAERKLLFLRIGQENPLH
jgi:hypothetical protein